MHQNYEGPERRTPRMTPREPKWKFDPTVNLGHILTFIGFLLTGFMAYSALDKRVLVLEESKNTQAQVDRTQDLILNQQMQQIREALTELKTGVQRMNDRVDRVTK